MHNSEYPVSVSIDTLRFDGEGSGEKDTYTYAGRVSLAGDFTLTYPSGEGVTATLCFSPASPEILTLTQRGDIECTLVFRAGESHATLYRISGVGELAMEICTRRVENAETNGVRRIRLDYEATVGGARSRTVMTLHIQKTE